MTTEYLKKDNHLYPLSKIIGKTCLKAVTIKGGNNKLSPSLQKRRY